MKPNKNELKSLELFKYLPENQLKKLTEIAYKRYYFKNELILTSGQKGKAVYFVYKGLVKIYSGVEDNDKEGIIQFIREGEIFGSAFLFEKENIIPANALALKETTVICIDIKEFKRFLNKKPEIYKELLGVFTARLRSAQYMLMLLKEKRAEKRIIKTLYHLVNNYGVKIDDKIVIDLQCTHEDIADLAGTTRETVNKTLKSLEKNDVIEIQQRIIYIQDLEELMQEVMKVS